MPGPQRPDRGIGGGGRTLAPAAHGLNPASRIPPPPWSAAAAASRQARCHASTDPHIRRDPRLLGLRNY